MKVITQLENPLTSGRRALSVVELIGGRRGGLSFSQLESALEISPASLTRLLRMLCAEDWIRQEEMTRHYIASSRLLQLGDDMRSHTPALDALAPVVTDLSRQTGHSACFATFQGDHFTLLAKTEARRGYHFLDVFTPNFDWIDNAMGPFLLAFQQADVVDRIYRRYFRRAVPHAHRQLFSSIAATRTLVRNDGVVTRVISAVALDDAEPIENLIALAPLTSAAPKAEPLLPMVIEAAKAIGQRLKAQGLTLGAVLPSERARKGAVNE
jgi:DNA-binding IclR family transcriptional regulator